MVKGSPPCRSSDSRLCIALGRLAAVVLACVALGQAAGAADAPSTPLVTVVLERSSLLAGRSVNVFVWVSNPTSEALSRVILRYAGPEYIKLGRPDPKVSAACKTFPVGQAIPLGGPQGLAARSAMQNPEVLCLKADDSVQEEDINIAFSVDYAMPGPPPVHSGVVVTEKKLSIGLFGTDSVAGVSLRLASYVIPGLLLMLILKIGGIAWVKELDAGELGTLSVLVSIILSTGAEWLAGAGRLGVSARLFLALCVIAIAIALLTIWFSRAVAEYRRRNIVAQADDDADALAKALHAAANYRPTNVIDKDRKRHIGSLSVKTDDGGIALLGWFELNPPAGSRLRQQLGDLLNARSYLEALQLAEKNGLAPTMANGIRTATPEGRFDSQGEAQRRFRKGEFRQAYQDEVPGLGITSGPLSLR